MRTELKPRETVVLECPQHLYVLINPALIFIIMMFLAIAFRNTSPGFSKFLAFLTVVSLLRLGWAFLSRKANLLIVTNLRVIREAGVISHGAKESPLDKINNVSFSVPFWGRIYRYGSVQLQTAAGMGSTVLRFVASPAILKDTITKCQEDYRQTLIADQADKLAQAIRNGNSATTQAIPDDTKECPACAETIKAKAKVCRFCGKELG